VTIFSTLAGLLFGAWLEGLGGWAIAAVLAGCVGLLLVIAAWTGRQSRRKMGLAEGTE